MANQYINNFADTWNNAGTTFHGIKLNVTNSASAADSNLLTLQVGSVDMFEVTKAGAVVAASSITSGGAVLVAANDGGALGASGTAFSDLFLASGGVINFANGDAVVTHSAGILTVSTGDLRVTTAGTNTASVVTVDGTQALTNKTVKDDTFAIVDPADTTKKVRFDAGTVTTATTRVLTVPDSDGTLLTTTSGAATQSDQETATSTSTYVSPGRQHHHPSAAKGWVECGVTGNIFASYNVISVTDVGAGQASVGWSTDFSAGTYAVFCHAAANFGGTAATTYVTSINSPLAATHTQTACANLSTFTATDPSAWSFVAFGDQ